MLHSLGAQTIATVGSAAKAQVAKDAGAEVVLVEDELGDEGVKEAVQKHTAGEGVRAVFDGVGKSTFDRSLDCVARKVSKRYGSHPLFTRHESFRMRHVVLTRLLIKGSLVSFGNASGAVEPFKIA